MTIEIDIKNYQGIILKVTRKHQRIYGGEWEEIEGEARVIFYESIKSWLPERGKFITHFSWNLKKLHQLVGGRSYYENNDEFIEEITPNIGSFGNDPSLFIEFLDLLDGLSLYSKEVVSEIFNFPMDILENCGFHQKKLIGKLRNLLKIKGWKEHQTRKCFLEIKNIL